MDIVDMGISQAPNPYLNFIPSIGSGWNRNWVIMNVYEQVLVLRSVLQYILYPVIKCECSNKKVADPRSKHLEEILQQKWCPNCRRRGHWRTLSDDESRWD